MLVTVKNEFQKCTFNVFNDIINKLFNSAMK